VRKPKTKRFAFVTGVDLAATHLPTRHAAKVFAGPNAPGALLRAYEQAANTSRAGGRSVSFRVDVDRRGNAVVSSIRDTIPAVTRTPEQPSEPDVELQMALAAARARGGALAAKILDGDDMVTGEQLADMLGTSRMTVNTRRQNGQLLGLNGAKRGYRFPTWQLDADGKPYAELAELHRLLGGPWPVYRFLVQPHPELRGLTGREALERGKANVALEVAESVGRDFR
jgi:hypothetical protein